MCSAILLGLYLFFVLTMAFIYVTIRHDICFIAKILICMAVVPFLALIIPFVLGMILAVKISDGVTEIQELMKTL
jgi:hypothetical protein